MATAKTDKHNEFHWTPLNFGLSVLMGITAAVGIWLFTAILMGLFML